MDSKRQFIKLMMGFFGAMGLLFSPLATGVRVVFATAKKLILDRGTRVETLVDKNPADLDTRNLELTPLKDFGTMGLTDHRVDLNTWRLEIIGQAPRPLVLTYSEILQLPAIERDVLLVCPGVFAYHARWKGVSVAEILKNAQVNPDATHVIFKGPDGTYEKTQSFPIADIRSERVFLSYQVNGEVLPEKHGFPLRVVADGYYGSDWVKYVYKVSANK
jgi:DMSO/TMAO reductase YedYZ molybdopterin-dependent catalytic subunit